MKTKLKIQGITNYESEAAVTQSVQFRGVQEDKEIVTPDFSFISINITKLSLFSKFKVGDVWDFELTKTD